MSEREFFNAPQEIHPERIFVLKNIEENDQVIFDLGCGNHKTIERAVGVDTYGSPDKKEDIEELASIADESVDVLISRHSFEHCLDPIKTLRNWLRVLKKGGRLIIVLPDHEFINTIDPFYSDGKHLHAYTRASFSHLISCLPFEITEPVTVVPNWSFGAILCKQ